MLEVSLADNDQDEFDREMEALQRRLPSRIGRFLRWLRKPASRWVRIPLGSILVLGGLFSFLPVLGLWMLPLGLILLAQDIPVLRGPILRMLKWLERAWHRWRQARRRR